MKIYSLSSGSKGNCTLVETMSVNVLIDVGISMKKINQLLLMSSGIDLDDVSTILITHAHIDHIKSISTIINKYPNIKVVCSKETYDGINENLKKILDISRFTLTTSKLVGKQLIITPFSLNHDEPCQGYMIYDQRSYETYVHIADNGALFDKDIIRLISNKDYYSIESNHDRTLQILDKKRHEGLRRRVLGYYGHSNNVDAIKLAFNVVGQKTKGIIFNHLSDECNSEELARDVHEEMIKIWGKKTEFRYIEIKYARQDEIVLL